MVLKKGSKGSDVRELQERLIDRGFLQPPADGDFGPKTKAAVEAFQRAEGLGVDGIAGSQTLGALGIAGSGASSGTTSGTPSPDYHVTEAAALAKLPQLTAAGRALGVPGGFCHRDVLTGASGTSFADYLTANGIRHFSVSEVITPNHPGKARQAGFSDLTPPPHLWPWAVLVLTLGDRMRDAVAAPVTLRNLYRPMRYNRLVASSGIRSDHPNGAAGDFDFGSGAQRQTAEDEMRQVAADHPELAISLGLGARTLHVGCLSPQGSRSWFYDSYSGPRRPFP